MATNMLKERKQVDYMPFIANRFFNDLQFRLTGLLIGNGWMDPIRQVTLYSYRHILLINNFIQYSSYVRFAVDKKILSGSYLVRS